VLQYFFEDNINVRVAQAAHAFYYFHNPRNQREKLFNNVFTWHLTSSQERAEAEMFVGFDHVGVAVKNLDEAVRVYRDVLGFKFEGIHVLTERKLRVALFSTGNETKIELLEPLSSDSTVAKFLETRGEGIQHVAVKVDDIDAYLADMRRKGVALIDDKPQIGLEGKKIAFIHPRSAKGVLLELCEQR
jgi:methylmalonyl-CoA/ethylmalonyl-CoA epimerase